MRVSRYFLDKRDRELKPSNSGPWVTFKQYKQLEAEIAELKLEIEADNRNVANLMDQVDELGKENAQLVKQLDLHKMHTEYKEALTDLSQSIGVDDGKDN